LPQDPNQMDPLTYNNLVSRAHLRSIRLTSSRFDMKPEALDLDPDAWRNNVGAGAVQTFLEPESGSLYGVLAYEVTCRQGRKRVLSVSATYLVNYHIEGECDSAACELFVERVGKIASYPYFRGLVASLTAQAGLTMRPLPVLSFAPRSVESAASLEQSSSEVADRGKHLPPP
jgi:preprotein translocase subunit SecB